MQGGVNYDRITPQGLGSCAADRRGPELLAVDTVVLVHRAGAGPRPVRPAGRRRASPHHVIGGADVAAELDAKRAIDQAPAGRAARRAPATHLPGPLRRGCARPRPPAPCSSFPCLERSAVIPRIGRGPAAILPDLARPIPPHHLRICSHGETNGSTDRNGSLCHGRGPRRLHRCGQEDGDFEICRFETRLGAGGPSWRAAAEPHHPPRPPDRDRPGLLRPRPPRAERCGRGGCAGHLDAIGALGPVAHLGRHRFRGEPAVADPGGFPAGIPRHHREHGAEQPLCRTDLRRLRHGDPGRRSGRQQPARPQADRDDQADDRRAGLFPEIRPPA